MDLDFFSVLPDDEESRLESNSDFRAWKHEEEKPQITVKRKE